MNNERAHPGCLRLLLFIGAGLLSLLLIWLVFNFRTGPGDGRPVVQVGAETTLITEPLDANGEPDFLAAANLHNSQGVTPDNNAVVRLIDAVGVLPNVNLELESMFFDQLGVSPPVDDGNGFVSFYSFVEESDGTALLGVGADEHLSVAFDYAASYPWSKEDFPGLVQWLEVNEPSMETAREGISRSGYFYPLVSPNYPKLMTANLLWLNHFKDMGDCLSVGAMQRLQLGDVDRCVSDLQAVHRLGVHIGSGWTLIEQLIGSGITNGAYERIRVVCASEKASVDQLKQLLKWAENLQPVGGTAKRIDQAERWMAIDAVISMARGRKDLNGMIGGEVESALAFGSTFIDWNETLRVMNARYDRLAEVAREENFELLKQRISDMDAELVAFEKRAVGDGITSVLFGRKSKGKWAGEMISNLMMPAAMQICQAEFASKTRLRTMQHAIASSIFKKQTGAWPKSPDDVADLFSTQPPVDPYSLQPFVYVGQDSVFQIQSATLKTVAGKNTFGPDEDHLKMELKIESWEDRLAP